MAINSEGNVRIPSDNFHNLSNLMCITDEHIIGEPWIVGIGIRFRYLSG